MDSERWNHVDKLLQSALDRPAAERDIFLRRACDGDEQLEQEIRSLVAAYELACGHTDSRSAEKAVGPIVSSD